MILESILEINPDAKVVVYGDSADNIEWHDGTTPISKEDILAKQAELQAEYDAQEYARNRKAEYPSIDELVVALYDTEDKTVIDEKRAAVKAKYPKP
ncbi:MAG: hypothetical protein HOB54_02215 [Flavobacteriales bacterium]|jgi:hypothetical protein|nr:hypothetical protein [Flavobacteriales bacterium]